MMLIHHSAGKVLSFRPDEGTECFLMQYVLTISPSLLPNTSLSLKATTNFLLEPAPSDFSFALSHNRRRCDSDDQFISFENDSENVDDLSGLDWIGDANSFMCVKEK